MKYCKNTSKHCCPLTAFSKGWSLTDWSLTKGCARCEHGKLEGYRGSLQQQRFFVCHKASLVYTSVRTQRMNQSCTLAVHGRILPFVYYIFNAHYLCCLVTLKHSNAVFKNTFIALPCTLYSKRSTQGSNAWQHRAGHWWFLTPRRTHWPSEALSFCYLLWRNSSRVCSVLPELPQNHSRACLMKKAL